MESWNVTGTTSYYLETVPESGERTLGCRSWSPDAVPWKLTWGSWSLETVVWKFWLKVQVSTRRSASWNVRMGEQRSVAEVWKLRSEYWSAQAGDWTLSLTLSLETMIWKLASTMFPGTVVTNVRSGNEEVVKCENPC